MTNTWISPTQFRAAARVTAGAAPAARRILRMAKRMLIDATHPEETRVAVVGRKAA